jgi:hypothetical protein
MKSIFSFTIGSLPLFLCSYLIIYFNLNSVVLSYERFFNISSSQWDKEFKKGKWSYLNTAMVEKSRNMVVSVMIDLHGINGTLLDVGCGMLLTLVAFL